MTQLLFKEISSKQATLISLSSIVLIKFEAVSKFSALPVSSHAKPLPNILRFNFFNLNTDLIYPQSPVRFF